MYLGLVQNPIDFQTDPITINILAKMEILASPHLFECVFITCQNFHFGKYVRLTVSSLILKSLDSWERVQIRIL